MKFVASFILSCILLLCNTSFAQHLKPGFDKQEFIELLKLGAWATADSSYYDTMPAPLHSTMIYQSPEVGLDNLWQLWMRDDSVAVINVRGTTTTGVSFLANLYAAMVSAKGELHLEKNFDFKYNLSDDPKAAVHIGFLISTAYLSRDIVPKIDSLYKTGIKEFIIAGHSQGGAITYLLTSYLENLKEANTIPNDIRFKTCASAAPKPGNLYYAYQFENLTRNGWAYNVVSNVDWVPEVPLGVQTIHDFNPVNPFTHAKTLIKKLKFPKNLALKHIYNRMTGPSLKAQKRYEKYLGKMVSKLIKKTLPDFIPPVYFKSNNYVRTGTTIVLYADSAYYKRFPQNVNTVWMNHPQTPYLFLTKRLPDNPNQNKAMKQKLNGSWELNYITGIRIAFKGLYPEKKPIITFDVANNKINGNTSCNIFNGKLEATGHKINFASPMAMTMMACPGEGENTFLKTLKKVTTYSVEDDTLIFFMNEIPMMKFSKM